MFKSSPQIYFPSVYHEGGRGCNGRINREDMAARGFFRQVLTAQALRGKMDSRRTGYHKTARQDNGIRNVYGVKEGTV